MADFRDIAKTNDPAGGRQFERGEGRRVFDGIGARPDPNRVVVLAPHPKMGGHLAGGGGIQGVRRLLLGNALMPGDFFVDIDNDFPLREIKCFRDRIQPDGYRKAICRPPQ